MLFNSYTFLFIFLPLTLLAWWVPRRTTTRLALLIVASYVFYGWFDWRFMALMFAVTCSGYVAGRNIASATDPRRRRVWLATAVAVNVGLLGYYKYAGFFTRILDSVSGALGYHTPVPVVSILLPLGVSFYVFENLSYCIDLYRHRAEPARSFLHYMLFISIFPKLIAGPIIRYTDVEAQYRSIRRRIDERMLWMGLVFFTVGMVKKVIIADRAAVVAAPILAGTGHGVVEAWLGVTAYTVQIYFDFSGYSDMAVGLGFMLGFRFPKNFDRPYLATSISDFWDRWHITLSRWLRDYLFIPLGGSRRGVAVTLRNLLIVMFLGGLWHGAAWTFVFWGLYQGALLVGYHAWREIRGEDSPLTLPRWLARLVTLGAVMVGWALFASPGMRAASSLVQGMLGLNGVGDLPFAIMSSETFLGTMGLAAIWILFVPEVWDWRMLTAPRRRHAIWAAVASVVCIGALGGFSPFIYFQF